MYQNSCCLPTEYSTTSVSTRHNIQHVALFHICVTKVQWPSQHINTALTDMQNKHKILYCTQLPQHKRKATPILKQHKGNVPLSRYMTIALTWHIIPPVRVLNWVTGSHPLSNGCLWGHSRIAVVRGEGCSLWGTFWGSRSAEYRSFDTT